MVVVVSAPAYALKPKVHADVTQQSCQRAGLAKDTCTRIATEDYDTDNREWDDLRAHAQIDDGETACTAADGAAARMWNLGAELHTTLATFARTGTYDDAGAVDAVIGRALHTVQDGCAHEGMPNPQHAWFSLADFCEGTATNPDVQPEAITCARAESDAILAIVATELRSSGVASQLGTHSCPPAPETDHGGQTTAVCEGRFLPSPFEACDFLGRAADWDGVDRTWNAAVVAPALRAAYADGVAGRAAPSSMCHGDERVLSSATSRPTVDVTRGTPSCVSAKLFCLGKADDAENPFADDPEPSEAGGCAVGGDTGLGTLAALALALGSRRRRRT
jgi:hypothetical protein